MFQEFKRNCILFPLFSFLLILRICLETQLSVKPTWLMFATVNIKTRYATEMSRKCQVQKADNKNQTVEQILQVLPASAAVGQTI
jgi:hypothetical protein